MSRLTRPKLLVVKLAVNADRNTVELVEQIAKCLHIAIGQQEKPLEYIQLTEIRTTNKQEVAHG